MRCPHHPRNEVAGYCSVCGDLGCSECLTTHEGKLYCRRDFKPIADKLEKRKRFGDAVLRPERQRLVVHGKEGQVACGVCLALNTDSEGFHLDLVDRHGGPMGRTIHVPFRELKAVFHVKSYDGVFDSDQDYGIWQPEGGPIVVEFQDGEAIPGRTLQPYHPEDARFYIVPENSETNNLRILVERDAIKTIWQPEEYRAWLEQDIERFVSRQSAQGIPQEESLGDYYFDRHDYTQALAAYRHARSAGLSSPRLTKKMASTQYNLGVRYIKRHDFQHALDHMQLALQMDPHNDRAKRKMAQLEQALARKGLITDSDSRP